MSATPASPPFAGRVALVTGGSGGIGRPLVLDLADAGAAVAVGYGASREPAEELASDVVAAGGRAIAVGADLRDPAAPGKLVGVAERALGPIDLLVRPPYSAREGRDALGHLRKLLCGLMA